MKNLTPAERNAFLRFIREAVKKFNFFYHTDFSAEPLPDGCGLVICFPTKAERWAVKMAGEARKAANRGELTIAMREQVTAVSVHEFKSIGIAICSPSDSYDADIGIAIAYCRATGKAIPDYVL